MDNVFGGGTFNIKVLNHNVKSSKLKEKTVSNKTKEAIVRFHFDIPDEVVKKITNRRNYPNCTIECFYGTNISILEQKIHEDGNSEVAIEMFKDYEYEDVKIYRNHFLITFEHMTNPLLSIIVTCNFPKDYQRKYTITTIEENEETGEEQNTPFLVWSTNRKSLDVKR